MSDSRVVEFFEISEAKSVLNEIDGELSPQQMSQFVRQVKRLEDHGWKLGPSYFSKVKGQAESLFEFRLSLKDIEYRVLFSPEPGDVFVMLAAYKEKRNAVPPGKVASARVRIKLWRAEQEKKRKGSPGSPNPQRKKN